MVLLVLVVLLLEEEVLVVMVLVLVVDNTKPEIWFLGDIFGKVFLHTLSNFKGYFKHVFFFKKLGVKNKKLFV